MPGKFIETECFLVKDDAIRPSFNAETNETTGNYTPVTIQCPTKLSNEDFYRLQLGDAKVRDAFYEEASAFVKSKLGCDRVICVQSQVRNTDKEGTGGGVGGYAIGGPHTDASLTGADNVALAMLQQKGEDPSDYKRYIYLNLWRNISDSEPVHNDHLAMLDERSIVKPDDFLPSDFFMKGSDGTLMRLPQFSLRARNAKHHKWYYFDKMTNDEAILFKQMDSDFTKESRICFHQAIHDKSMKDYPTRESIELRMMCYWKDAKVDTMPTEATTNDGSAETVPSSLTNATVWELLSTLTSKLFGMFSFTSKSKSYTGDPSDYGAKFATAVKYYKYWPSSAKTWIENTFAGSTSFEDGLASITKVLLNDPTGQNGTRGFTAQEKSSIVEFLLQHEPFLEQAKEQWSDLSK